MGEILDREGLTCSVGTRAEQARGEDRLRLPEARRADRRPAQRGAGVPGWPPDRVIPGIGPEDGAIPSREEHQDRGPAQGHRGGRAPGVVREGGRGSPPEGARALGRARIERVGAQVGRGAGDLRDGQPRSRLRPRAGAGARLDRVPAVRRRALRGVPHRDRHRALLGLHDREPVENRQDPVHRRGAAADRGPPGLLEPFFDARGEPEGQADPPHRGAGRRSSCPRHERVLAPPTSPWTVAVEPAPETRPLEGDRRADVVVVGAGYTGLSAALHLAERGAEVVVLDAAEPGWGASGRNGGQVIPGLKHDPDELERRFGEETGRRMWQTAGAAADFVFELIARHKIACHAERCGWIAAAPHAAALESLRSRTEQWQRRGAPVELLDGEPDRRADRDHRLRGRHARPPRRRAPAAGVRSRAGPGRPAGRRGPPRALGGRTARRRRREAGAWRRRPGAWPRPR